MEHNIYELDDYWTFSKKSNKIQKDNTKHYPNQDEAKLLRKIMSNTGLNEQEVRSIKKYRVMLSDAQKLGQKPKRSAVKKWYQKRIKEACKITGLAPQHPDTIKVLDEILENRKFLWNRPWYLFGYNSNLNAKTVVRDYAK